MSALRFLHQVNIVLLFFKLLRPFTLSDINLKASAIKCYVHFKNENRIRSQRQKKNACANELQINDSNATWKTYLIHLLKPVGGKFFLNCNYEVSDYTISSQFYQELLLWWSEFRESLASESDWKIIV